MKISSTMSFSPDALLQCGASLLFFPLFSILASCTLLVFGVAYSTQISILSLTFGAACSIILATRAFRAPLLGTALSFATAIFVSIFLATSLYDTSIDGQNYHFDGINALANGWNPYWHILPEENTVPSPWVIHYPKGAWFFAASLIRSGLPLQSAQAINFIVLLSALLVSCSVLMKLGFSSLTAILLGSAVTLNPVALGQLFTAMNDGLIASLILLFLCGLVLWSIFELWGGLAIAAVSMAIALNLKFSAIPIFSILALFALSAVVYIRSWRRALETTVILFLAGAIATTYIGWNPYVTNSVHFGHPFYPLMGSKPIDIMAGNRPEFLNSMSAAGRFCYSLFAETHSGYETVPKLKIPLLIFQSELRNAGGVDTRIAGLGPFFSAAFVLGVFGLFVLLPRVQKSKISLTALVIYCALGTSIALMPENWWARYVPQLWLLPIVIAIALLAESTTSAKRLLAAAIAAVIWTNLFISGAASFALAAKRSAAVSDQISQMKTQSTPYCVFPELAHSRIAVFRQAGISVRSVSQRSTLSCANPLQLAAYGPDRVGGAICPCE